MTATVPLALQVGQVFSADIVVADVKPGMARLVFNGRSLGWWSNAELGAKGALKPTGPVSPASKGNP